MTLKQAQALLHQHGLTVTESMTTPKRAHKPPRPVWLVSGRLDPFRALLYDLGGRTRYSGRNTFSFWDDPTIDIAEGIEEQGEATLEAQVALKDERSAERAERYSQRAQTKRQQRDQAYHRSHAAVAGIEPGQPVLVGHHSETHHRRALERSHRAMGQSVQADRAATRLSEKAAGSQAQVQKRQSKAYLGNRLRDAEAKKRQAERDLAQFPDHPTYLLNLQDAEAAIAHWSQELDSAGVLTPDDMAKGDFIRFIGRWYEVVRVNPKSVTITRWLDIEGWTYRVPYSEIQAHKPKAEAKAEAQTEGEGPPQG
ncbi:DUF3560 domain-containing protein [Leptolyngbya sp. BL0902]|uniref:DUF3560 domain-containing protein n=1 Tax=Leptolyngbya sp. BL0902 TaxID=1115757 RepID=UPI0018E85C4F|nr:DUF3560 domain-containing protein [Leptolyngbya sp. BL0902]